MTFVHSIACAWYFKAAFTRTNWNLIRLTVWYGWPTLSWAVPFFLHCRRVAHYNLQINLLNVKALKPVHGQHVNWSNIVQLSPSENSVSSVGHSCRYIRAKQWISFTTIYCWWGWQEGNIGFHRNNYLFYWQSLNAYIDSNINWHQHHSGLVYEVYLYPK